MMMHKGLLTVGLVMACLLGGLSLAGAAPAGPLAQVIEAAKKEGPVSAKLQPTFTERSMSRLEKEIKAKYGVDVKIKFTGSTNFNNDVAESIMEQKAGAVPSYDILTMSNHIAQANKAGVLEQVDWKPLLSEGTNPNVVHDSPLMRGGIVYMTSHLGLLYNPEKVNPSEVPKTLADMANPKWKGRGGVPTSGNSWIRWAYVMGKDKLLSDLRAVMKNGTIQARRPDLFNRYLIGEIWFCIVASDNMIESREKGMPAQWQTLGFADVQEYSVVIRKGARSANAAKLIGLYLASPEGAKFVLEEAGGGNLHYAGNFEHDVRTQNDKQGYSELYADRKTEILEFYTSKEAAQLDKEITLILQTGGAR